MPRKRRSGVASRPAVDIGRPLALVALLLLAVLVGGAALGVPDGLWQQPGLAHLRGGILEILGGPAPETGPPPATAAPEAWYHVYFTDPHYPDNVSDHHDGIDQHLVQLMAGARRSVDVAAYELDLDTVAEAMLRAKERGVAVRLVTDADNLDEEPVGRLAAGGIRVVADERSAIMHDKFVVVDGRYVWTGSWNLTVNCTYRNNNNAILIESPDLARNYQVEFDEMFEGHQFGPRSPSDTPSPQVWVDGTLVESYFAPEDGVGERVAAMAAGAKESIRFLAFSFTDERLGQVLIERARAGVEVTGVVEERGSESDYAQLGPLRRAGLDVLVDGNPYVMHHKVLIVDEEIVVTGSFNFSESADRDNDENVLIIHSPGVARWYMDEYQRVRQRAAGAD